MHLQGDGQRGEAAWASPVAADDSDTGPCGSSAGGRRSGRHGEAVPPADLPPQPTLPVEAAPRAGEEEATGLVSLSPQGKPAQPSHTLPGLPGQVTGRAGAQEVWGEAPKGVAGGKSSQEHIPVRNVQVSSPVEPPMACCTVHDPYRKQWG